MGLRFCKTNGYILTNHVGHVNMFDFISISTYNEHSREWEHRYYFLASFATKKICGYRGGMQASADKIVQVLAKYENDEVTKIAAQFNAADDQKKMIFLRRARKMPILDLEREQSSETTCWRCVCCLQATPAGMASCLRCNAAFIMFEDEVKHC